MRPTNHEDLKNLSESGMIRIFQSLIFEKTEAVVLNVITRSQGKDTCSKQDVNKDTVNSTDEKLTSLLKDLCQVLNKKV